MQKEVPMIKRLNTQIAALKAFDFVEDTTVLQRRSEKKHYPDGYSEAPVVRKAIDDDMVIILKIKDSPETVGFAFNYNGRALEDAELSVGTSFRIEKQRTLTQSAKIVGYENIKEKLNAFIKEVKGNPDESIVTIAERSFNIVLTPENESNRSLAQKLHAGKVSRVKELTSLKVSIESNALDSRDDIKNQISESPEAKLVKKLKLELAEAERALQKKKEDIYKPIENMQSQAGTVSQEIHLLNLSINEKSTVTHDGENVYQAPAVKTKRRPK